ncbi:hypothetical protein G7054_g6228 [Neopestalotiopsis clavispora]|nr:hypothetical protein G7054_g6228 [Neopestalotiopsis clavispora]
MIEVHLLIYSQGFRQSQWNNMEDMKEHLDKHLVHKEKDPYLRHVFLSADNSSAPLDCTFDMFHYLCTYHQVPPDFANLLSSFGRENGIPRDFHHTHLFQQIDGKLSNRLAIQTLGRSGFETRLGYKLSAMEFSQKKWTMRQTIAYHSLDLGTGRSFWMTTKANDEIFKRVIEASRDTHGPISAIPLTPQAALSNALHTHLIITDWCSEGWRWYISGVEMEMRNIFDKITAAPIPPEDIALDPIGDLVRIVSFPRSDTLTSQQSMLSGSTWTRDTKGVGMFGQGHTGQSATRDMANLASSSTIPMQWLPGHSTPRANRDMQVEHTKKRIEILKEFSLDEVKQLNFAISKLREARMVMDLNITILGELREYYSNLFEAPDLSKEIREECALDFHEFKSRVSSTEMFMTSERLRCDTLMDQLKDGKDMYGLILESRSLEREKLVTIHSYESTERMENSSKRVERVTNAMHKIALDTEKDTSSMHIITFFTLIFLPGTFLATFFSTPIFGDGSKTAFDNRLFLIFLEICLPLMVITLAAWMIYTRYKKTRRRRSEEQDEGQIC